MMKNLDFLDRVSVLVVGDIMLDRYLWGDTQRISPEAPVPVVEIEKETYTPGGAANVANNLAALGVQCELFGLIGEDQSGEELRRSLRQCNVRFDARLVNPRVPTITKTRIVAQRQQLCRLDKESSRDTYSLATGDLLGLLIEKAADYDAVILSDYAKGIITQQVMDALRAARNEHGFFLAMDPKPQRPLEIRGLDLLTPNLAEGLLLAGTTVDGQKHPDPNTIAAAIYDRHLPKCLVMTMGAGGMLLRNNQGTSRHYPPVVHQVADVSGAGDTVISTLAAAMAGGLPAESAIDLANAAAGVVVGKLGTATVTRQELMQAVTSSPDAR